MKKILGIAALLLVICLVTAAMSEYFLTPYNIENLIRRTALFGIISIGVAFVIITGGIDLSIGSVIGLIGTLFAWLLVHQGWPVWAALSFVMALSLGIGLLHGTLITRLGLQPFVVTLCGLLFYRGVARWLTDDQTQGFGRAYDNLRLLAVGRPLAMATLLVGAGAAILLIWVFRLLRARMRGDPTSDEAVAAHRGIGERRFWLALGLGLILSGSLLVPTMMVPAPFLILLVVATLAAVFLNRTIWGRYLLALGRNEQAARYSGIPTARMVVLAYVLSSGLAGLGGILFALEVNSVQPAGHGAFYELYAIAAAVLGGCSLRGGEGSILGVVIGAAIMRVLYNSINILGISTTLEFAIIGAVILIGVSVDELVKRLAAQRRATRQAIADPARAPG